jgi:hypothetical protein
VKRELDENVTEAAAVDELSNDKYCSRSWMSRSMLLNQIYTI